MSLIRLSCLKNVAYAPRSTGEFIAQGYNHRQRTGKMESFGPDAFAEADSAFHRYLTAQIADATANLAAGSPVVVLVHGFLFDPRQAVSPDPKDTDNPHGRIFHFRDLGEVSEVREHTTGWPLMLGFQEDDPDGSSGLALAFGWQSNPGFASSLIHHFENFYARAYENAELSAWVLIQTLRELALVLPGRPIDLLAHSLGTHVVVRAIAKAASLALEAKDEGLRDGYRALLDALGRMILLGGAEYVVEANLMYDRLARLQAAGGLAKERGPVFYNVASRENDVLDLLGENFGPRTFGNTQVIGHNGLAAHSGQPRWIDLQIDGGRLQRWMRDQRGITVSGDGPGVWDHWYYYTYRGNQPLYRRILRDRDAFSLQALRKGQVPEGVEIPWYRFGD